VDWIALAQDRDRWRALCKDGDESSGSVKCRDSFFLLAEELLSSLEGVFTVELVVR
jgi:hypothetical protein